MPWLSPFPLELVACASADDWSKLGPHQAMLPLPPHSGAFGDAREKHFHEGIDLYAPAQTPVLAVENCTVIAITPFSGISTRKDYWRDMEAVLVQGASGLIAYCEFNPLASLVPAMTLKAGDPVGKVYPDGYKFRKAADKHEDHAHHAFLHLELHASHVRVPSTWELGKPKPLTLFDPTPLLLFKSGQA